MNIHQLFGRKTMLLSLIAAGALAYFYLSGHIHAIGRFIFQSDVAGSIEYIRSYGSNAEFAVFFIIIAINVVAVLPNIVVLAAAGAIFGIVKGTIIAWLAETVGVTISFVLMRYFLRERARRVIEHHGFLGRLDDFSGKRGFRLTLLARSVPYVPSGLITALAALSSVSFKDHLAATLIGKLPSAWIEVTVGHDLLAYREHAFRLTALAVVSALAYFLFGRSDGKGEG